MDSAAEWTQVGKLTPWDKNPRKNDGAIKEVARSIITLGWGAPIVAWQGRVVAGHTRLKAADLIARKWKRAKDKDDWHPDAVRVATTAEVPVRHRDDLTEEQADLLALADNKLGEIADWDEELLAEVLAKFSAEEREIAGWTDPEKAPPEPRDEPTGEPMLGGITYQIVIECENEDTQGELLQRLEGEGLKCRPLIL